METNAPTNLDWLKEFLPLLRCPDTHQALRWAETADFVRHGQPENIPALVNQDGSQFFPIDQGIPLLLPKAARITE